jgi:hypothetical protein
MIGNTNTQPCVQCGERLGGRYGSLCWSCWERSHRAARPVTRASAIPKTRLRWTWRGRLALGYLAVWCGAGDIGKSLCASWVVRGLTRGELEGKFYGTPRDALTICSEDGRADMWVPRLEAAGADLERVLFLDYPADWNLRDGVSWIDRAVRDAPVPLIFIDSLMSHMPDPHGGENTRSPTFVRAALQPLADLSRELSLTALFGLHPRKAGGDTFADVVQESGAFTQLPRLGLMFGYHPDDRHLPQCEQRRVIVRGKGNVGRNPGALSFRIAEKFLDYGDGEPDGIADGVPYIADVRPCSVTERQLLHPTTDERPASKVDQTVALIGMALHDGEWHPAGPIREELERQGLNHDANVQAAKSRLGVKSFKQPGVTHGPWGWQIGHSSNSAVNPDSWRPRATLDLSPILDAEHSPKGSNHGKNQRITRDERTVDEPAGPNLVRWRHVDLGELRPR